jgi:hypothetical protein
LGQFNGVWVPSEAESREAEETSEGEDDEATDELDVMKAREYEERKSTRNRYSDA